MPRAYTKSIAVVGLEEEELLGRGDVATTLIYTQVLKKPGLALRSPLDMIWFQPMIPEIDEKKFVFKGEFSPHSR